MEQGTSDREEEPTERPVEEETESEAPRSTRRRFLRRALLAGAGVAAAGLGAAYFTGLIRPRPSERPPWEVAPGVVDYTLVPIPPRGSTVTLRIAQWFDYWPPTFLDQSDWSFRAHMQREYGIDIRYQIDYFTSMEDLFLWVSPLQRKEFDVFVPSNELAPVFDLAGWLYNLNEDWLPNYQYVDPTLVDVPTDDPWNRRGPGGPLRSIPYFWGTTGIGFRTQDAQGNPTFDRTAIEDLGWEAFLQTSIAGTPVDRRMNMLNEMRDVLIIGFKMAGWGWQEGQSLIPSGDLPPSGNQWSSNETDPLRVDAAKQWLLGARPHIFNFDSTTVITNLQTGTTLLNHAWSGDAIVANSPDGVTPFPVDYVVPKQGGRWWVDAMSLHSKSKNLWVAHQFMDYIHDPIVMRNLAVWNKYACTNEEARALIPLSENNYDLANDPRLYPDATTFRRLDLALPVSIDVLENVYNPTWTAIKFGGT